MERNCKLGLESQGTPVVVTFDDRVFCLMAIKKAAYAYSRTFSAEITSQGSQIHCQLIFTVPVDEAARARFVEEFRKEVLDQDLRERLKAETETVRNVILAHAFSKTGLSTNESLPRD